MRFHIHTTPCIAGGLVSDELGFGRKNIFPRKCMGACGRADTRVSIHRFLQEMSFNYLFICFFSNPPWGDIWGRQLIAGTSSGV